MLMRKLLLSLVVVLGMTLSVAAQNIRISGSIADVAGEPILGATITVDGTNLGTTSDINGEFSFLAPRAGDLVVTYIGYNTVTTPISGKTNFQIVIEEDSQALEDVIVVAYGTQTKASFTGSASVVDSESLGKRVITNATSAFEGTSSGVQVTSATGQPGDEAEIRVRGFGSMNASSDPLFVVDGAVYDGYLSDINPSDIESMTVLKDAASTSLYGSSAGNGVILITTKKGKTEGSVVNFSIRNGWSSRSYADYSTVGIADFYETNWTMLKNAYVTSGTYSESEAASVASAGLIDKLGGYNVYTGIADGAVVGTDGKINSSASALKWGDDLDWEDAAFRTGYRQEYNMGYNTKGAKSDTYASVSYLNDEGYMIETDFERYTARLSHNVNPTDWFKSGVNVNLSRVSSNYSIATESSSSTYGNLVRFVRNMSPIYPVHKHDLTTGDYLDSFGNVTTNPDEYVYDYDGTRLSDAGRDAVAETYLNRRLLTRNAQTANAYVTFLPIEGLNITANYSLNNTGYNSSIFYNPYVGDGQGSGNLYTSRSNTLSQTLNQLVSYNFELGENHFDFLAGHENYSYEYNYVYVAKKEQVLDGLYEMDNFLTVSSTSSYTDNYTKEGYFARMNYNYGGKYYLSASYRRDGSSRFSAENRWGDFYSAGASWRVIEEDFMASASWVDDLKLRVSYGETGNDGLDGYYAYQNLYEGGYNSGEEAGIYYTDIANADLKWETQVSTDVAVEFGFLGWLSGSVEFFKKDSKDLLFDVSIPASSGATSTIANVGKVSNKGVEVNLDFKVIDTKDWSLGINANATYYKNEIVKLPEGMESGYIDDQTIWMEGYSMYEFYLYQWYGVDSATGDGLFYLDTDTYNAADGTLSSSVEETIVEVDGKTLTNSYIYAKKDYSGASTPDVYGGFGFNLGYKNFDLGATFSYQLGGQVIDYSYRTLMDVSDYTKTKHTDILDAWTTPGDITDVPRVDANSTHTTSIGQAYSTRWLVSSDYLNLRSVNLGYNVPKELLTKYQIKSLRVSVAAENLFMLKARDGLNPMGNYSGIIYNSSLPTRSYTIGLDLSF